MAAHQALPFLGFSRQEHWTHVARLEFSRETGLLLRCAGKAGNPFQTRQGLLPPQGVRNEVSRPPGLCWCIYICIYTFQIFFYYRLSQDIKSEKQKLRAQVRPESRAVSPCDAGPETQPSSGQLSQIAGWSVPSKRLPDWASLDLPGKSHGRRTLVGHSPWGR